MNQKSLLVRFISKLKREGLSRTLFAAAIYPFRYKYRAKYNAMLKLPTMNDRFNAIYANNLWKSKESGSGLGSELIYTVNIRNWLIDAIPKYSISKFVDAPCGDFNWMKHVVDAANFDYIGIDIVKDVIDNNTRLYQSERTKFVLADICNDKIPPCDILMVRDCLFHLSYQDIDKFFRNIASVDFKYLLITSHIVSSGYNNTDIISGDFRLIDLFAKPFNINPDSVIESVDDFPHGHAVPRKMVLLAKKDVPSCLIFN